jgi:hypothetical protein
MGRFLDIAMPWANDQMSMDVEHALMIGEFIKRAGINTVVEVGCCYGISTGAILDAFDAMVEREDRFELRQKRHLHLIDVKFQQPVLDMYSAVKLEPYNDTDISIDNAPSLSTYCDSQHTTLGRFYGEVVILDGDHSEEVVVAEAKLVESWKKPPAAIVLHDTGREGGLPGPRAAVYYLRKQGWIACHNTTAGARGIRGLTICAASWDERELYETAADVLGGV